MGIRSFLNKFHLVQVAVIALPIGFGLATDRPVFIAPPLGVLSVYVLPLATMVALVSGVSTWLLGNLRLVSLTIKVSLVSLVLFVAVYTVLISRFVVSVQRFSPDQTATVTVGYYKTAYASATFPNATPRQMLIEHGHREEDICELWEEGSVHVVRSAILGVYALIFAAMSVFTGSLAQMDNLKGKGTQHYPTSPAAPNPA